MRRTAGLLLLACCGAAGAACAVEPAPPFGPPARIALGGGRVPEAVAAGDFDGDGRIDLVVASEGAGDVTVLLGDGRGGFRVGRSFPAGAHPTEIFVADFDHDGRPDLAIAN
ncbi:MAG TPA: VCBS repeat-containing protein, partial [Thermoanaerobaculia bacterium]|nr:VCBS repeat-containing protein [Thermoanaerobaculia bacterium]